MPSVPSAHAVGRVGCFLGGCCHGVYSERFGIAFSESPVSENGVPYFPIQLVEAAGEIAIASVLLFAAKKDRGYTSLGIYLVLYSAMRFVLEFFRGDAERGYVGALSVSQFIGLFTFAAGCVLLIFLKISEKVNVNS